jgi:drug/metabolite transporter (DMT)-like permease
MKNKQLLQGMLLLAIAQILVAINIVSTKLILSTIPIMALLIVRFSLASLVLLPLHWAANGYKISFKSQISKVNYRDWLYICGQALCAGVLFNLLMIYGLHYTDANIAGIIMSALPAIIAIMSWLFLRERISWQKILCIVFAVAGLLIIALHKFYTHTTFINSLLGDFLIILSLLPEAGYYILCKIYPNPHLPLFFTAFIANSINALVLLPMFLLIHWNLSTTPLTSWIILLILGLSTGLFYVSWLKGAQWVDGTTASLFTALMPIATLALAWLILGESLGTIECFAIVLIICSILFNART